MEKFNKFLDFIMADKTASIIFYVILGSLALLFLVLIITTFASIGKKGKEKDAQNLVSEEKDKEEEVKVESKSVTEDKKEEIKKEETTVIDEKEPLTETMTFNDMLMKPESSEVDKKDEEVSSVYLDKSVDIKSDYNENLMESIIKKVDAPLEKADDTKESSVSMEEKVKADHDTLNSASAESIQTSNSDIYQLLNNSSNSEKSIGELLSIKETEKPTLESAVISGIETNYLDKQDETIGTTFNEEDKEKIKPKFMEEEISKLPVESNEKKDFVSNDELRSRLEKLKGLHNQNATFGKETSDETEKIDSELESIMKSVGLEDTMVIPNIKSEEKILGK
jgi:hypothetical protein